jgi:hypothetical protein
MSLTTSVNFFFSVHSLDFQTKACAAEEAFVRFVWRLAPVAGVVAFGFGMVSLEGVV